MGRDSTLPKRAYITSLGRSVWALVNTYYAVLREREYHPDVVHVFTTTQYEPDLNKTLSAIKILNAEFGITPEVTNKVVDDVEFYYATKTIFDMIKRLKDEGYRVAIDITPGRKALVVATVIPATRIGVDHVFYLSIRSTDDAAKPYMMIPLQHQQIRDFIEYNQRVME
jgi:hypothetical protein